MSSFGLYPTFDINALPPEAVYALRLNTYACNTGFLPCGPASGVTNCRWIKNTSTDKNLIFWQINESYDGGVVVGEVGQQSAKWVGRAFGSEPTGQFVSIPAAPLTTDPNVAFPSPDVDIKVWDGDTTVPGGMIMADAGVAGFFLQLGKGNNRVQPLGLVLTPGQAINCTLECPSLSSFSESCIFSIVPQSMF